MPHDSDFQQAIGARVDYLNSKLCRCPYDAGTCIVHAKAARISKNSGHKNLLGPATSANRVNSSLHFVHKMRHPAWPRKLISLDVRCFFRGLLIFWFFCGVRCLAAIADIEEQAGKEGSKEWMREQLQNDRIVL